MTGSSGVKAGWVRLMRLPEEARNAVAGGGVAFVGVLFGAELLLGGEGAVHVLRLGVLVGLMAASWFLAVHLLTGRAPVHPAERLAAVKAFGGPPGSAVAIEGAVRV